MQEQVEGVEFEETLEHLDPLTAAVVFGGAALLGNFLVRLWREIEGGTVIDLTKDPVQINRSRDLAYGYFLVVAKDGSVKVEAKDEPETALERLTTAVLKLPVDAAASAVKAAIEAAAGDAKVTTETTPAN
ncbi:hypothetical protein GKE82_26365 [Conexibacter sp. W3-3-2]|uniref:hypothetical protein n=1 Tax=Conexibacter sp. W3-3-2 TaxID=2675227 RepID=UPI0012BA1244|nr:hypothetical protein [Conexibacter sp. W3-3-2]MTD47641.1 hypothetical protein [Conexibacter sp. W3-3-2]MTD47729.1 hypothetical protein [Conexibacter sp. W3-3-2]